MIVPRHRHTAVARNRLKRRLRELVRTQLLPAAPPLLARRFEVVTEPSRMIVLAVTPAASKKSVPVPPGL